MRQQEKVRPSWRHTETPTRGEEDDQQAISSSKQPPRSPHEQEKVQPLVLVHVVWRQLLWLLVCGCAVEGSGGSTSLVLSSPDDTACGSSPLLLPLFPPP